MIDALARRVATPAAARCGYVALRLCGFEPPTILTLTKLQVKCDQWMYGGDKLSLSASLYQGESDLSFLFF